MSYPQTKKKICEVHNFHFFDHSVKLSVSFVCLFSSQFCKKIDFLFTFFNLWQKNQEIVPQDLETGCKPVLLI